MALTSTNPRLMFFCEETGILHNYLNQLIPEDYPELITLDDMTNAACIVQGAPLKLYTIVFYSSTHTEPPKRWFFKTEELRNEAYDQIMVILGNYLRGN